MALGIENLGSGSSGINGVYYKGVRYANQAMVNAAKQQEASALAAKSAPAPVPRQSSMAGLQSAGSGGSSGMSSYSAQQSQAAQIAAEREAQQRQYAHERAMQTSAAGYNTASQTSQAGLQAEAEARRIGQLGQVTAATQQPMVSRGPVGGEDEARAAAFSRAKDQAGAIARSSLTSLRGQMSERGISGSSIEGLRSAGVVGQAGAELGQFNNEQLIQDLSRNADISDQEYQGQIQQRGQNLGLAPSLLALVGGRAY